MTPTDNSQTLPRILILECHAASSAAYHEVVLDSVTRCQTLDHRLKVDYVPAGLFDGPDPQCASPGCDMDVHAAGFVGLNLAYGTQDFEESSRQRLVGL